MHLLFYFAEEDWELTPMIWTVPCLEDQGIYDGSPQNPMILFRLLTVSNFSEFPTRLEAFFQSNTSSSYTATEAIFTIADPWGDDTLELRLPKDVPEEVFEALNSVHLPPRFTGIWHMDSKDFELIYTAFRIPNTLQERSFVFRFIGHEFRCEFAAASDRLLKIASVSQPIATPTHTFFRNLEQFTMRQHFLREHPREASTDTPISFWIRSIDWEENFVAELARHLNFFMEYYDRTTPQILIHDATSAESASEYRLVEQEQGAFPELIAGRRLDDYLLSLWDGLNTATSPFLTFMYGYQILEYAAFYYLREEILLAVKRVLAAPDAPSRIQETAHLVIDAIAEERMADEAKIQVVMQRLVSSEMLWRFIHANKTFFSTASEFDGGFALDALVRSEWTYDDFKAAWVPKVPDALRKIRNALVHSREARSARAIAPTRANNERLRPWARLVRQAAMELIAYEGL